MQKQRRRPGQGAASDTHVAIENINGGSIADPGTGPQTSAMQSFWADAGGFVTCTLIRPSDRPWWLTALAAGDETASAFRRSLRDRKAHAGPTCLGCEVTFTRRFPPTGWAMLTPVLGSPGTAMLSGICRACSAKSDAELMDAALRDLQAQNSAIRRIEVTSGAGRA
jgi:hypothetical protein